MADAVPEGLTVGIGRTALLFRSALTCTREFGNRCCGGLGKLGIELLLAFQTVDFLAEVHYIRFHLVVAGGIFRRHHAVFITDRVQERLGCIPQILTFFTQC